MKTASRRFLVLVFAGTFAAAGVRGGTSDGKALTATATEEQPEEYKNWIELAIGGVITSGDRAQFEQEHRLPGDQVYGGIQDLQANVLPGLIRSLRALDYPAAKLEVFLVLEAVDTETQAAVLKIALPGNFRSLVVPEGRPQTKPKALIGEDDLPWPEIFDLCETIGSTEWYVVEYESDAYPPLVSVEKTLQVMRRWGKC